MNHEEHILQSWHANAAPWASAIKTEAIESRKLVTNKAIADAILQYHPKTLLDVGCGEGWLCRAMQLHGIKTTGIDAIPALISSAKEQSDGTFEVVSYQDIAAGKFNPPALFDAMVFNFSLFGNELVAAMLNKLHTFLTAHGKLFIQTLHPHTASADQPYIEGWREGNWNGFSEEFTNPAPWYFRTIESWVNLLTTSGFNLLQLQEPVNERTGKPASIIFICTSVQ
jgi:2-polyprenyl-3-methyl-5-hydroxy-6-metoxy-1,4-benzoquinol methylase